MSAAPDLVALFGFEKQIEPAVVTVLAAATVPAVRQTGNADLATPRVEVKLHMGAPTGHRKVLTGSERTPSQTVPDAWHAQLVLTTLTNRRNVQGNADRHDELVGRSRVVMLQALGTLNAALAWLSVHKLDDVGVVPGVQAGADLDVSPLVFAIQFSIRPDAWPAVITG